MELNMRRHLFSLAALAASAALLCPALLPAEPVAVRFVEGLVHGFLVLRSTDGTQLANGDLIQVSRAGRVTSQIVFHFKDGSVQDETAVFSQRDNFRLLTDHLVQKGPTFQQPLDMTIDAQTGQVTVRYTDDGKEKVEEERLDLPPDLTNGIMIVLLKNLGSSGLPKTVSFVAATPKPQLVKLVISSAGADAFSIAGSARKATHYVIKVDIGGVKGLIAPLVGKQPPDTHVWILGGTAPAFVKSEGPLYPGGPSWRIELTSPVWPGARPATSR
jgi:hypothetical protein